MTKNKICPGCKKPKLVSPEIRNAMSRRGHYYVCSDCGTREAMEDYAKAQKKINQSDIAIAKVMNEGR